MSSMPRTDADVSLMNIAAELEVIADTAEKTDTIMNTQYLSDIATNLSWLSVLKDINSNLEAIVAILKGAEQ